MPMMNEDMPPMRERMGGRMMDNEPQGEQEEQSSVFLPKSALMGKQVKAGDKITMTVKDVDPETGDVEAVCDYGGGGSKSEGYEEAFDRAMPEESEMA